MARKARTRAKGMAPGKSYRNGLTEPDFYAMFPDDAVAQAWLEQIRWGDTPFCPKCGSENVRRDERHPTMSHRCREKECRKHFSVRTNSAMARTHIGYRAWVITIYKLTTSLKSVSSMKSYRDLGITQKSAWFLAHRLRLAWEAQCGADKHGGGFFGPVEVDETYMGGKRRNMSNAERRALAHEGYARGPSGKTAVVAVKDRKSNQVVARVTDRLTGEALQGFVSEHVFPESHVYSDESAAYKGMRQQHDSVTHSASEYVRGDVHVNGVESLWSMLKRAPQGHFSQDESETHEPLCSGVRRSSQPAR